METNHGVNLSHHHTDTGISHCLSTDVRGPNHYQEKNDSVFQSENTQSGKHRNRRQGVASVFHGNCPVLGMPGDHLHSMCYSNIIIVAITRTKAGKCSLLFAH